LLAQFCTGNKKHPADYRITDWTGGNDGGTNDDRWTTTIWQVEHRFWVASFENYLQNCSRPAHNVPFTNVTSHGIDREHQKLMRSFFMAQIGEIYRSCKNKEGAFNKKPRVPLFDQNSSQVKARPLHICGYP
jgi:hypothetical protein